VSADQRDWMDYVELAEFSYNAATHLSRHLRWPMEWSHSNFADLVLKGAYSSLKFSQVDEDLATK
jgi:hypothetical protein